MGIPLNLLIIYGKDPNFKALSQMTHQRQIDYTGVGV